MERHLDADGHEEGCATPRRGRHDVTRVLWRGHNWPVSGNPTTLHYVTHDPASLEMLQKGRLNMIWIRRGRAADAIG